MAGTRTAAMRDPAEQGYVDVATRIAEFRDKHPDGSLQPADLARPYAQMTIGADEFVVVVAAAYRSADDLRPGIGMAYEPYPGRTPYTRGSELQNAETSAWGRAIVAALAADTKRGVASADEVRNRQADRDEDEPRLAQPAQLRARIAALGKAKQKSLDEVAADFAMWSVGTTIGEADTELLAKYITAINEGEALA
jgi:hypothetical protein